MRVAVMGDTHGDLEALKSVVRDAGKVDAWFHTGDYSQDTLYLKELVDVPVYSVCGNCDSYEGRAPQEAIVKLNGFTIAMTHGNRYIFGESLGGLATWGTFKEADIVLFGHTHVPVVKEMEGVLLVNPGSPARPRKGLPSYAELYLEKGEKPVANICYL